ncbi:zinc finger protein 782 [Danaus plexippus plexippus]|uniref:Zinc finger protein 782 n=1 Tax=Danaus plexippus plexippus TaxID=278856 RepID=A0A212F3L2_DANPL|nr:zinc finger protein 782 [Danaus plexippus plexippus]
MENSTNENDYENKIPLNAIVNIKPTSSAHHKFENVLIENDMKLIAINTIDDIRYLCRICLTNEDNMISLMSTIDSELLVDIFSYVTSIKAQLEADLPQQICDTCYDDLLQCYKLRKKSLKSEQTLRKVLKLDSGCCSDDISVTIMTKEKGIQTDCNDLIKLCEENGPRRINFKDEDFKTEYEESHEVEYLDDDFFESNDIVTKDVVHSMNRETQQNDMKTLIEMKSEKAVKNFRKIKTLRAHMKKCRNTEVKNSFPCGKCKETFSHEQDLCIHSALHTKGNKWTCNECQKEFTERNRFRRHIRRHMACWRLACDACGKTFAEPCALRRHARVHTGERKEKTLRCDICDKRFSDRTQLATHSTRHSGLMPCSCSVCGKAFPSQRLLASHARVHSDLKPYACLYCDKRFRHESTRNTHHRTHTGEKPYVCSICGKTFIQNSNLKLHMRTHTGEKPFECAICSEKFGRKNYLVKHLRTHKNKVNKDTVKNQEIVILQEVPFVVEDSVIYNEDPGNEVSLDTGVNTVSNKNITLEVSEEIPIGVSGELILHENGEEKTELVVVDNIQNGMNFTNGDICLDGNVNYVNDVSLVGVNDDVPSSASSAEETTMKLYKLDQSLVQIQTSTGQLTIRKMTANF